MRIGDKVQHSEYFLRPYVDSVQQCGEYSRKASLQAGVTKLRNRRGTVVECDDSTVKVEWADGCISHGYRHLYAIAKD